MHRSPSLPTTTCPARACSALLVVGIWLLAAAPLAALTPQSPEVRKAIERGMAFLEQETDTRLGAQALVARIMLAEGRLEHPKIAEALATAEAELARNRPIDIYSLGLTITLLAELDAEVHRGLIERFISRLVAQQKPHGGWGYSGRPTGDTSMTQHAVLGLWTASRHNIPGSLEAWESVTNWLLRTQDPSGAWSYQGVDPESFERIEQPEVRPSMGVAGLASLYFCATHLQLLPIRKANADVPEVLQRAEAAVQVSPLTDAVDAARVAEARQLGERWVSEHGSELSEQYPYYHLYAIERYNALREAVTGESEREPPWYNDGAAYLFRQQMAQGQWNAGERPVPATCFAILFLLRSTRQTLGRDPGLGAGTLVGGRGVPGTGEEVALAGGQLRVRPLEGPADELLALLENPDHPDYLRAVEALAELELPEEPEPEDPRVEQLRRIAGSDNPAAKAAALRVLGSTHDVDHAPLLIAALDDASPEVFRAGVEALRTLSRNLRDVQPGIATDPESRKAQVDYWTRWLEDIRPGR